MIKSAQIYRFILSSLGVLALAIATPGFAKEYIVKLREGASLMTALSGQALQEFHPEGNLGLVKIDHKNAVKALADLMSRPDVEYVVENVKVHALTQSVDTEALKEQWALKKVNAEKAWQLARNRGSKRVTVAVIDTGIDYRHESLKPNMVDGFDYRDNDSDPMDDVGAQNPGHGTHCAGIIGATGLIDGGVIGISPEVSLMPIRFLGKDGSGDLMGGIKSIDFAISKKVEVISASWGAAVNPSQAQPLIEAVKRASDAGVIFVSAAANDGKSNDRTPMYPANAIFENTITVAASGPQDEKPSWSNFGKRNVSLAAPGLNIMSTLPGNKYQNLSGTSMATPLVAGLVALLKAQRPDLTGLQVRSLMQATGAQVGIETACQCRIDAGEAMEKLMNQSLIVTPAAGAFKVGESFEINGLHARGNIEVSSLNSEIASVSGNRVTVNAAGEFQIKIKDAGGREATSLKFTAFTGNDDGGGGNPGGECPLGDQMLCDALCQFLPQLPWCSK